MRFHILDTETAGLNPFPHGGGVCEISVREYDENLNEVAHHYSILDPEGVIGAGAESIHGISNERVKDEPTMQEWLEIVLPENLWGDHAEDFYFIAHNAPFDHKFLARYIDCGYKLVDTLMLARRYYPDAENHKLPTLAVMLKLEEFSAKDAHGAAADTQVLAAFVKRLCLDTGMTLTELCEDAQRKEPILKMPFGKHKGKLLSDLAKTERSYLNWCLNKMESLQPDMREAIEEALASA